MTSRPQSPSRRKFLGAAVAPFLLRYHHLAAADKNRVKIRDIQTMTLQGDRTYTLVKVVPDSGLYGIAEAYGTPAQSPPRCQRN